MEMSATSEELTPACNTQSAQSSAIPVQNTMSTANAPRSISNTQCALGVQVNGPGQVTISGDVVVSQQVQHNHTEECQVDRLVRNVQRETNKAVDSVGNEAERSGKKVEKEVKRFLRRF